MRITADTNVLVRAVVGDEPRQSAAAQAALKGAQTVAVPLPALCEFVWVLMDSYGFGRSEIASAVRALMNSANVAADRPAVEAGLALLEAGGDFADGAIAFEGARLGGERFLSFDKKAVKFLTAQRVPAQLIG